jgi:hypothetical protein
MNCSRSPDSSRSRDNVCRTRGKARVGVEMEGDELREELEHADDFRRLQHAGLGIDRAKRAEECSVRQKNGHRYVVLKPYIAGA